MKKLITLILAMAMCTSLAACSGAAVTETSTASSTAQTAVTQTTATVTPTKTETAKIGVAMPTKDLQRWNQDGANMKAGLEKAGYEVDLQYASDDINTQISQIETMIANGVDILVIASIDGESLGTVMSQAKEKNIPVIAYDRLIKNTDAVTYYATFDNTVVGKKMGEYIRDTLKLDSAGNKVYNIEIFAGDPGDNNATYVYNGGMSVLQKYIDAGTLKVVSGQVKFAEVATAGWKTENAQSRMENIIASFYADGTNLDAVFCSNDSTALGSINALDASYTGTWPVITGQDCDKANVKAILAGKQTMSVFKDTRDLAAKVVEMVDAIMKGSEPSINDTTTYNNGVYVVPSYLCDPVACTKDNYKTLLIDSGYYVEADIK